MYVAGLFCVSQFRDLNSLSLITLIQQLCVILPIELYVVYVSLGIVVRITGMI